MQNVQDFVAWALKRTKKGSVPAGAKLAIDLALVGSVTEAEYLWGTVGQIVTQALLDKRYASYYRGNGWTKKEYKDATRGWVDAQKRVTDCQGMLDWYLGNDTNADGNYRKYCTSKGLCSAIKRPYVIGEAVFNGSDSKKTHVGWVCGFDTAGNPLVVEARGLAYGVVVTNMKTRAWKYRGLMTAKFAYGDAECQPPMQGAFVFSRNLKSGCKGDDVMALKRLLIKDGYTAGITANNQNFASRTKAAVKAYQRDNGLTVDGVAGKKTIESLSGVWNG